MTGAPTIDAIFSERLVVGVGDMAVSNRPNMTISTFALGSCVGIAAYDPQKKVGGMIHIMLPESRLSPERAAKNPACFADTGIPRFFKTFQGMEASLQKLRIFVGGGANVMANADYFKVGERNLRAINHEFTKLGLKAHYHATGGCHNRTLHLALQDGSLTLKTPDKSTRIPLQ